MRRLLGVAYQKNDINCRSAGGPIRMVDLRHIAELIAELVPPLRELIFQRNSRNSKLRKRLQLFGRGLTIMRSDMLPKVKYLFPGKLPINTRSGILSFSSALITLIS